MSPLDKTAAAREWMRSRPPEVQATMRRFPPCCRVRANRPLVCPHPGTVGVVASYFENGDLGVVQENERDVLFIPTRGACEPSWLEVVGYAEPYTPEFVAEALGPEVRS